MRRVPLGALLTTLVVAAGSTITWRRARAAWPFGCGCCGCDGSGPLHADGR